MAGLIPPGLVPPTGVDPMEFYLQLPAMNPKHAPKGADMTMTTDGPDQVWFLVVAVTCIAVPALFLSLRVYTRLAIFRSLEVADCKYVVLLSRITTNYFQTSCSWHSYVQFPDVKEISTNTGLAFDRS